MVWEEWYSATECLGEPKTSCKADVYVSDIHELVS